MRGGTLVLSHGNGMRNVSWVLDQFWQWRRSLVCYSSKSLQGTTALKVWIFNFPIRKLGCTCFEARFRD